MYLPRKIERDSTGAVRLNFDEEELLVLRELLAELQGLLEDPDDPAVQRLFPPAHDDLESEEQYRSLVRGQLVSGRAEALAAVRETLGRDAQPQGGGRVAARAQRPAPRVGHSPRRNRGHRPREARSPRTSGPRLGRVRVPLLASGRARRGARGGMRPLGGRPSTQQNTGPGTGIVRAGLVVTETCERRVASPRAPAVASQRGRLRRDRRPSE